MIRVDKILEYIETPLRRTLQDDNPYVRKTAVICVAKLFQLNKDLCIELGVLEDLQSALDDSNPMVVANATASLSEINDMDPNVIDLKTLIQSHVSQFLMALNECTEWARITILGALSEYSAKDSLEAQDIIDRVTAHLQHVNPAVVLATIKVIIKNLPEVEISANGLTMKKLSSALVSLMSSPSEMQYVALKNIRIILEKYPEILSKELRIFYIKFNDPLYVKVEKIDILVRLVDPTNLKQCALLLTEMKEYSMEFEPEFVSRAIQGLAQLGIKYSDERFVQKILDTLLELVERDQDSIKDDCCISMCNLLRHSPSNEKLAEQVCSLLNSWSEPDAILRTDSAKCNYVWLMGQYPQFFPSLQAKMDIFVKLFKQEESLTQMSILITVVKLHSKLPGTMLQHVLELATQETNELDVRDMAMMYWRCLSMDNSEQLVNDLCKTIPPQIENTLDKFSPELLEKLLLELGTISSIYFKPQSDRRRRTITYQNIVKGKHIDELQDLAKNEIESKGNNDVLLDFDDDDDNGEGDDDDDIEMNSTSNGNSHLADLDDLFDFGTAPTTSEINNGVSNLNIRSDSSNTQSQNNPKLSSNTQDLLELF